MDEEKPIAIFSHVPCLFVLQVEEAHHSDLPQVSTDENGRTALCAGQVSWPGEAALWSVVPQIRSEHVKRFDVVRVTHAQQHIHRGSALLPFLILFTDSCKPLQLVKSQNDFTFFGPSRAFHTTFTAGLRRRPWYRCRCPSLFLRHRCHANRHCHYRPRCRCHYRSCCCR